MSSIFQGATINTDHTLRDWGCAITNSDIISVPEPNLTVLEIPGRNGRLDLSEALTGDITYGNRTIKLELAVSVNISTWFNKCDYIFRNYHGKIVTVTFDDDLTHYYRGRSAEGSERWHSHFYCGCGAFPVQENTDGYCHAGQHYKKHNQHGTYACMSDDQSHGGL